MYGLVMDLTMDLPKELIQNYVERRVLDLESLKKSLAAKEISEFHRIGHQLAGNALSYGFKDLEHIGRRMEQLPANLLDSEGPQLLGSFEAWLEQVKSKK